MNNPVFLLASGAGAGIAHPRMRKFAAMLATLGPVHLFDYPYRLEGKKRPDPLPRLIEAHRAALAEAQHRLGQNVILVGKSMGGRVGCHLALQTSVPAVICLGYPLCGAGDRKKLRDAVLCDLTTPVFFVQGTRDALCPLDLLEGTRAKMRAPNALHVIEGADHSLILSKTQIKTSGVSQDQSDAAIVAAIAGFIAGLPAIMAPGAPAHSP